jgi:glycosyltransferase involved in cell wall biosynthesis
MALPDIPINIPDIVPAPRLSVWPLVSILIPAHNAAPWLAATLESALAQTWPNTEIIVIENQSTDDTKAIADRYQTRGVQVLTAPRAGAAAARNLGFATSRGEWIQYLDADDLLSPDKLTLQMSGLDADPTALSLSARSEFFDGDDPLAAPVQRGWPFVASREPAVWLANLLGAGGPGGFVALHQWLTPRTLIEQAGPWNESLTVNDDGEFFSRVLLHAREIRTNLQAVAYYRRHRSNRNLSSAYRRSRVHLESMLTATDLIAGRLLAVRPDPQLKRALSRHYYECAVFAHPQHTGVSRMAEAKALALDPAARPPEATSRMGSLIRGCFGWRAERRLAYYYRMLRPVS